MENHDRPKNGPPKDSWEYNSYFREYLLLLARKGKLGLESINNYPNTIKLSPEWHKTLNTIRQNTRNGKEYWSYVGFKSDMRSIWLPVTPIQGHDRRVPGALIKEETQKAKDKFGIVGLLGDVHSHPRDFWHTTRQRLPKIKTPSLKGHFSLGDLYTIANTEYFRLFIGLVDGNYNLFVFRTRETSGLVVDSSQFSQGQFEKYWYDNNGFRLLESDQKTGKESLEVISPKADFDKLTGKVLEQHSLVLYQGLANRDLKKVSF